MISKIIKYFKRRKHCTFHDLDPTVLGFKLGEMQQENSFMYVLETNNERYWQQFIALSKNDDCVNGEIAVVYQLEKAVGHFKAISQQDMLESLADIGCSRAKAYLATQKRLSKIQHLFER